MEPKPDGVKDVLSAFGEAMSDDFLEILDEVISERRLSRTPDLRELAGKIDVPLGRCGAPSDEVR